MKLCCFEIQLDGMTYTDETIDYTIYTEIIGILNWDI